MGSNFYYLADEMQNKYLLETEKLFVSMKQKWFANFVEHFQSICNEVTKMQKESLLYSLTSLEYTITYSSFVKRQYVAEVWVYGDGMHFSKDQRMISKYDISFLFVYFDKLWDELLTLRKLYVGKVTSQDIKSLMIQALPKFYSYLTNIARFSIVDCVENEPFTGIVKSDVFKICVGEYMADTEPVFMQKKKKDTKTLVNLFSLNLEFDYCLEDYSSMDFSNQNISYTIIKYSQFRKAILEHTNFEGAELTGTCFYKAHMAFCCLDQCVIYEADFSFADLTNASFSGVEGEVGLLDEDFWTQVGFVPVSFRNADLTGANFTWANLTGADFTGANLTGTNFTGAILDNAIFSDGDLPLSEDQKSKIIIAAEPA